MTLKEQLTAAAIELAERGYLPDTWVRQGIRGLCRRRLQTEEDPALRLEAFKALAKQSPIAPVPDKANEQHYELPAEFFAYVLGRQRKYSCCLWDDATQTLDAAEELALRITCEHAQIEDGQRVLELGCGWGSLTLWIAQRYPNTQIMAVSNSHSQREFICRTAAERGIAGRVQVVTADMNDFSTSDRFDRVVSVEMFEHMRNHAALLQRIAGWLTPAGKLLVHIFCHENRVYEFSDQGPADWMSRYFFTGGIMPSRQLLAEYNEYLRLVESWRWNGRHYRMTAESWLQNMGRRREDILCVLRGVYSAEQADRWFRRWRMFFMACSELFGYAAGEEWFVMHYLFEPTGKA